MIFLWHRKRHKGWFHLKNIWVTETIYMLINGRIHIDQQYYMWNRDYLCQFLKIYFFKNHFHNVMFGVPIISKWYRKFCSAIEFLPNTIGCVFIGIILGFICLQALVNDRKKKLRGILNCGHCNGHFLTLVSPIT